MKKGAGRMVRSEGMPTFRRGLEGYGHLFVQFDIKFPLHMNLLEHPPIFIEGESKEKKKDKKAIKEEEEKERINNILRYEDKLITLRRFLKQTNVPLPAKTSREHLEDEIARVQNTMLLLGQDLEKLKTNLEYVQKPEFARQQIQTELAKAKQEGKAIMDIDLPKLVELKGDYGDGVIEYDDVPETLQPPPPGTNPQQISHRDLIEPDPRSKREHGATMEDDEDEGGHAGGERVQCASQ